MTLLKEHDLGTPAPVGDSSMAAVIARDVPAHPIAEHDLGTPPVAGSEVAATITVEVDGNPITVEEGTSVMRAAALAGIDIPKLCATDSLKAFGSCRLCLVEI